MAKYLVAVTEVTTFFVRLKAKSQADAENLALEYRTHSTGWIEDSVETLAAATTLPKNAEVEDFSDLDELIAREL